MATLAPTLRWISGDDIVIDMPGPDCSLITRALGNHLSWYLTRAQAEALRAALTELLGESAR